MTLKIKNLNTSEYKQKTYIPQGSQVQQSAYLTNSSQSKNVSFQGLDRLLYKYSDPIKDYKKLMKVAGKELGDLGDNLLSDLLSRKGVKGQKIIVNGSDIKFREDTLLKSLLESAAFPIIKLPALIADAVLNLGKKIPGIRKYARKAYDSPLLSSRRILDNTASDINIVKGIMDTTKSSIDGLLKNKKITSVDEVFNSAKNPKAVSDALFLTSNGGFSSKSGNYNTVHERSLNRLVTGMASAFFLANDAYNLSVLCGDKPEESEKEKKGRFKQEVSRVGSNAYLQLISLGALTGLVNKSGIFSALVTGTTVLFSETFSRLTNKKPIFFLTPEKAKKHNEMTSKLKDEENQNSKQPQNQQPNIAMQGIGNETPNTLHSAVFDKISFKSDSDDDKKEEDNIILAAAQHKVEKDDDDKDDDKETKTAAESKDKEDKKTLFSFKGLMIGVGALAALGMGFAFLRYNPKSNKKFPFGKIVGDVKNYWEKNLYPRLTQKDFEISSQEYSNIISKLKSADINTSKFEEIIGDTKGRSVVKLKMLDDDGVSQFVKVDKKVKPLIDTVIQPVKFVWGAVTLPYKVLKSLIKAPMNPIIKANKDSGNASEFARKYGSKLEEFSNNLFGKAKSSHKTTVEEAAATTLQKLSQKTKDLDMNIIDGQEFKNFAQKSMLKTFNGISHSKYSNADLAMLTKMAASTVTSAFLVADNYNMVMLKSNGEDKDGAKQKAQERVVQRISSLFYQTLMMKCFNSTFSDTYHSSLAGMSAVAGSSQVSMELLTRSSIGMPIRAKSYEELVAQDEKNINRKGLSGAYFRFMTKLTGKKPLAKKEPEKNKEIKFASEKNVNPEAAKNQVTTNILEQYIAK